MYLVGKQVRVCVERAECSLYSKQRWCPREETRDPSDEEESSGCRVAAEDAAEAAE